MPFLRSAPRRALVPVPSLAPAFLPLAFLLVASVGAGPAVAQLPIRGVAPDSRSSASLSLGTGPGQTTTAIPLTSYSVTGLPAGPATVADPTVTKGAPGVRFTTPDASGATVAALQSAAGNHSQIARVVLDHVMVGTRAIQVIFGTCTVASWAEVGSGHAATLQCARVISPSATSGSGSGYDLSGTHAER